MADLRKLKAITSVLKDEVPVNRIDMSYRDVTKRIPELTEAANKLARGEISPQEYANLVSVLKPVKPYDFVPRPATYEDAMRALAGEKKREGFGKTSTMVAGEPASLRLDIPAYKDHGVWVNSIHRKDAPTVYGSVSSVKNATMVPAPEKALQVAKGAPKSPFAVIKGDWNPMDEATAVAQAQRYLKDKDWRQVGYDPERHGYFYDRATMEPILGADEVIQIGPLVLAKRPRFGKPEDFPFKDGGPAMAGGGAIKKLSSIIRGPQEILPAAEREANLKQFLEHSAVKAPVYRGTDAGVMMSNKPFTYFSESPEVASTYAGYLSPDALSVTGLALKDLPIPPGAAVFPAHVSIKNPARPADVLRVAPNAKTLGEAFPAMKAAGFDGYIDGYQVVPFSEAQVRSKYQGKAGGGAIKKITSILKGTQEVLPAAERQANLAKFLEGSAVQSRLYHGTNKDVPEFSNAQLGSQTGNPTSHMGFFFSGSPEEASRYAKDFRGPEGGNVIPAYVNIKNPKRLSYKEMNDISMSMFDPNAPPWNTKEGKEAIKQRYLYAVDLAKQKRQELIDAGHDGAVVNIGGKDEYIVFDPTQIKSATGNRGTYDTTKKDITKKRGGRLTSVIK